MIVSEHMNDSRPKPNVGRGISINKIFGYRSPLAHMFLFFGFTMCAKRFDPATWNHGRTANAALSILIFSDTCPCLWHCIVRSNEFRTSDQRTVNTLGRFLGSCDACSCARCSLQMQCRAFAGVALPHGEHRPRVVSLCLWVALRLSAVLSVLAFKHRPRSLLQDSATSMVVKN